MLASGRVGISRYSDEFKDVFVTSPENDEQMSIQDHFLYTNAWQQPLV